jgi:hypothetical protein
MPERHYNYFQTKAVGALAELIGSLMPGGELDPTQRELCWDIVENISFYTRSRI